jgi:hypothetical protein
LRKCGDSRGPGDSPKAHSRVPESGTARPLRYARSKNISTTGPLNCRSLGFAPNEQKIKPTESISISSVHFTLNLPQASWLLGMTKGRVALTSAAVIQDGQRCRLTAIFISLGGPKARGSSGPTAGRGKRDDKFEGGDPLLAWFEVDGQNETASLCSSRAKAARISYAG